MYAHFYLAIGRNVVGGGSTGQITPLLYVIASQVKPGKPIIKHCTNNNSKKFLKSGASVPQKSITACLYFTCL